MKETSKVRKVAFVGNHMPRKYSIATFTTDLPAAVDGKNELFRRAIALLHLNTIPERFGLVLVEAKAAGVPVIARGLGSCREVIEDGVTGFLVDAAAASGWSGASPSKRWWKVTKRSARRSSNWRQRDEEARHRSPIRGKSDPYEGGHPCPVETVHNAAVVKYGDE